jgi:hypothetical protein
MGLVIAIVIVVLLVAVGVMLWTRSRRRGGVIAAPTGESKPSPRSGEGP